MAVTTRPDIAEGLSPGPGAPLLECTGICKRFGAVEALVDVEFDVADRIVVLYMGRRTATFDQRSTTPREVVSAIVGLEEA